MDAGHDQKVDLNKHDFNNVDDVRAMQKVDLNKYDFNNVDDARAAQIELLHLNLAEMKRRQADPKYPLDVSAHIKNMAFLLKFYQDGGNPPPPSTTRWVKDQKFVETTGIPEPFNQEIYTPDSKDDQHDRHGQHADEHGQFRLSATFGPGGGNNSERMHTMHAEVRIPGRPDLILPLTFGNDTGSTVQTLLIADILQLPPVSMCGIEMRITKDDETRTPLTEWFSEVAVVNTSGTSRLSGTGMRNHLYFCTAPGNALLYVAQTRNGLLSQLPSGSG